MINDKTIISIAVDVMGGDEGLSVTMPAVAKFLKKYQDVRVILAGDEVAIAKMAEEIDLDMRRIEIKHATEVVEMDELPQSALKNKKDSSMRVAINQIKEGNAQAAVSAGNTGALMATARFVLKTIAGIDRPAIAKFLPGKNDNLICALDLGANIDCSATQITQFAVLGSELVSALYPEKKHPKIGLLNVGSEEIKGTTVVKEAHTMLKDSYLNFTGNIEADKIFDGDIDVVVCDGFVGNVLLKTIEGSVGFISQVIKEEFKNSILSKAAALVAFPTLRRFKQKLDPRKYNGAIFLGLKGIVIKSHGGTDTEGFVYALVEAYNEAKSDYIAHLEQVVSKNMEQITTQEAINL